MKKCPKCGKMNFSNVSTCTDCGENMELVVAQNEANYPVVLECTGFGHG